MEQLIDQVIYFILYNLWILYPLVFLAVLLFAGIWLFYFLDKDKTKDNTQQAGGGNAAQPAGRSFSVVWSPRLLTVFAKATPCREQAGRLPPSAHL